MKIHLTLFLTIVVIYNVTSQARESYEKNIGIFIIKVTDEVTQNYADIDASTTDSIWNKTNSKFENSDIAVPKMPSVLVYKKEYKIHFLVKPKLFIQYKVDCNNNGDISNILKVDRNTLYGTNFNTYSFRLRENELDFKRHTEKEFEIVEYFKNDKKTICGFECYKIKVKTKTRIIEMYVTENIQLNYNPAFPNLHLLKKFYPLYVKEYLENYPNDVYKEYIFELK